MKTNLQAADSHSLLQPPPDSCSLNTDSCSFLQIPAAPRAFTFWCGFQLLWQILCFVNFTNQCFCSRILRIMEAGLIPVWEKKYGTRDNCASKAIATKTRMRPVRLTDAWFIFASFMVGTLASFVVLFWEIMCPKCKRLSGSVASIIRKHGNKENSNQS